MIANSARYFLIENFLGQKQHITHYGYQTRFSSSAIKWFVGQTGFGSPVLCKKTPLLRVPFFPWGHHLLGNSEYRALEVVALTLVNIAIYSIPRAQPFWATSLVNDIESISTLSQNGSPCICQNSNSGKLDAGYQLSLCRQALSRLADLTLGDLVGHSWRAFLQTQFCWLDQLLRYRLANKG